MSVKYYRVGGSVRDELLGVVSKDIDYAVEAPDYATMLAWIKSKGGKVFLEQPQYWTVRAHMPGKQPADFVLCRRDGQYSDGRRPDTVNVGTLYDDLARRDFTMNAIAYDEDKGEYIDPHNGIADLKAKFLRCVGSAKERFHEDALRILRAIRFAIVKDVTLCDQIQDAFSDKSLIDKLTTTISEERIREELYKCFAHSTAKTIHYLTQYKMVDCLFRSESNFWLMPTFRSR
jgi:tRNA nucleotidyltransferase (CCA-adding enzyme)